MLIVPVWTGRTANQHLSTQVSCGPPVPCVSRQPVAVGTLLVPHMRFYSAGFPSGHSVTVLIPGIRLFKEVCLLLVCVTQATASLCEGQRKTHVSVLFSTFSGFQRLSPGL